jgi:hypothetical protein
MCVGQNVLSFVAAVAAQHNYPGGDALTALNNHITASTTLSVARDLSQKQEQCRYFGPSRLPLPPSRHSHFYPATFSSESSGSDNGGVVLADCAVSVHIDAAAAMSGITR